MSSAPLPAVPDFPVAPSWRARLWRPNRWRLWVQFALLGAFVLIIPILVTSQRLLSSGRQVLLEHETIDLSDESNLRVNEIQEDMTYLARDVRLEVQQHAKLEAPVAVRTIREGIALEATPLGETPKTVRDARRRYLHDCEVGVFCLEFRPDAPTILAAALAPSEAGANDGPRQDALVVCLRDLDRRRRTIDDNNRPSPFDRSGIVPQPADGTHTGRGLVALGLEVEVGPAGRKLLYALVIDFTKYIRNRQRISPRHLYFAADPAGQLLIHPYGDDTSRERGIVGLLPWEYPPANWFDTAASKSEKQERLGRAVRSGGARLKAKPIPGLAYFYSKGYFGAGIDLRAALPNADPAAFNRLMAQELAADKELRVGESSPDTAYAEVSHPRRDKLLRICGIIERWHRDNGGAGPMAWSNPVECRTLQGQLTPLRIDLNDIDDPAWLIVAASPEELQEDIDDRFNRVAKNWVYPTLLVSCLLGIALVVTLTRSLRRLVTAARSISRGNSVAVPLGGPYEIGQLAQTLAEMTNRVAHRDRELRDRAARYETILRVAGEGVVITDSAGLIEEANRAAAKMFGYTSDELMGRPVTLLVENAGAILTPDDAASSTQTFLSRGVDTIQGRRKNGSTFWLEMNLKPVPLKDRTVVTCIFRDVSLRKEAEERVRKLNDDLESRVRVRTAELEEANAKLDGALKQAEAASRAKDAFVANMSHELRQPLHIIIGFTEALKEDAADLGADNIQPDLNKILGAAKHLLELINDILDMAKISSGKMELAAAPFELGPMIADVKNLVGPLAEKNENTFVVIPPTGIGPMVADERRVRQILINLLSNAFKFTRSGTVTLGVQQLYEEGRDWVQFSVKDTGKGMTPEEVQRLFQRFYQADSSTTREQGGTGLGLSITLNFSDLMGGQPIRVVSEPGRGSEFLVTLPLRVGDNLKSQRQVFLEPSAPPVLAGGRTVLVIDDDPMVRELMERFLAKDGFRVIQATGGEEGLRLAREEHPSVVTLDVMMPGSDGWSVLAHLKSHPDTADIPVVMLTIVDDRQRGFALGAADYLTKPIDWQRLGSILGKFLEPGHADTVLVIEDDTVSREIIRKYLERAGWKTIEASDGEQGLRAFAGARPALILLDLMMPVLDGFGFLDELGKRFPAHRVPVVVLTAKELNSADFVRLNGRVARILEKGDLAHLDKLMELIRQHARK